MVQPTRLAPLADTRTPLTVCLPARGQVALRLDAVWAYCELLCCLT